jgi:hypothetical protein
MWVDHLAFEVAPIANTPWPSLPHGSYISQLKWVGNRSEIILSDWHGRALELNGSIAIDENQNILAIRFSDKVNLGA